MQRKKNRLLVPALLFIAILALSIGGLILAQNLRNPQMDSPNGIADQDDIPRVTADEAYQALQNAEAVIVDTRSETAYQSQHISGSVNIPLDQIETRMDELDPETWVITYCT